MNYQIELKGNLSGQGGGHGVIQKCIVNPGNIQAIAKPVNHREGLAYPELLQTPLKEFLPKFFGIFEIENISYLIIEDLTSGFNSPSILDIKIGTRHYDLTANEKKINGLIEKAKDSTTPSLGIRLVDGKIKNNNKIIKHWDRKLGLIFTQNEFKNCLNEFFFSKNLKNQFNIQISNFINLFKNTLNLFPGLRIYASSLLFVYDSDSDLNNCELRIKLIDLAHLYLNINIEGVDMTQIEYDDGIIFGCSNLLNIFSER